MINLVVETHQISSKFCPNIVRFRLTVRSFNTQKYIITRSTVEQNLRSTASSKFCSKVSAAPFLPKNGAIKCQS